MPESWETLDSEVAYECDGFAVKNQTVRLPDGTETKFDYLTEPESAVILPFDTDGQVVTIAEWRQAVGRVNWGLPAGSLEGPEDPVEGARRELREETGYRAESIEHMVTLEPSNGYADSVFHYFVATGCERNDDQELDTDESISVRTVDYDTVLDALADGTFRDGRSASAILYYELYESSQESGNRDNS